MSEGSFSTGSTLTQLPFSSLRTKPLSRPVWQAMPPASPSHVLLRLLHGELAEMEHARRQDRIGAALEHSVGEVLERADAARGDHRHADRLGDRPRQAEIVAVAGPVAVHAGDEDLAGA